MIYVIAPPGCYGTYIARSLYFYSEPSLVPYVMDFDEHGSSHSYRNVKNSTVDKISNSHWDAGSFNLNSDPSKTVVVTANPANRLDYFNNQFSKNAKYDLMRYLNALWTTDGVSSKLDQFWGYTNGLNENTPRWLLRELCSYDMIPTWNNGYSNQKYLGIPHAFDFCCSELWNNNFYDLLINISKHIGTEILDSRENIETNHQSFLKCQSFHNCQHRIEAWVDYLLSSNCNEIDNPCVTIFDEAYVQYLLREKGYDIRCEDLNEFPNSVESMRKIIFKNT